MFTTVRGPRARQITRVSQIVGVALAAGAAAVWAWGLPVLNAPDTPLKPEPRPPQSASAAGAGASAMDPEVIATTADALSLAVKMTPLKEKPKAEGGPTAAAAPPPTPGAWKYLGSIVEPGRRLALVMIDGKQRLLAEGRELNGVKVVSVEDGKIVLSDSAGQRTIEKSKREGPAVAWTAIAKSTAPMPATAMAAASAAMQGMPQPGGQPGGPVTPAMRQQQMMAQARAAREQMLAQRAGQAAGQAAGNPAAGRGFNPAVNGQGVNGPGVGLANQPMNQPKNQPMNQPITTPDGTTRVIPSNPTQTISPTVSNNRQDKDANN